MKLAYTLTAKGIGRDRSSGADLQMRKILIANLLKRSLWLLGFAIFISSNVLGSVFQLASLSIVILAPLGAVR